VKVIADKTEEKCGGWVGKAASGGTRR